MSSSLGAQPERGLGLDVFRFRLRDAETGDYVGEFRTRSDRWRLGDEFTKDGRRFRIVDVMPALVALPEVAALWLVEPTDREETKRDLRRV